MLPTVLEAREPVWNPTVVNFRLPRLSQKSWFYGHFSLWVPGPLSGPRERWSQRMPEALSEPVSAFGLVSAGFRLAFILPGFWFGFRIDVA